MASPLAERVLEQFESAGNIYLKTISPNELGITGAHVAGFLLNKEIWPLLDSEEPRPGANVKWPVQVEWTDGRVTDSVVTWYGAAKREFRLTRFNGIRNFFYRHADRLGGVLVLIKSGNGSWYGHVLEGEEDQNSISAAIGVEVSRTGWALALKEVGVQTELPIFASECEVEGIETEVDGITEFPATIRMAALTHDIVYACNGTIDSDSLLMRFVDVEYALFRRIETKIYGSTVAVGFESLADFVGLANSVLQRRKSRAGKSLEWHILELFEAANVSFEYQPVLRGTKPDFVVPSVATYDAASGAEHDDVLVIAAKTTCKDRWRQVMAEAPGVKTRYLVTLQKGVSSNQVEEMRAANVRLVVPKPLHEYYAPGDLEYLMTIEDLIQLARGKVA